MADPSLFLPDPRTPSPNQSAPPSYSPTPLSQWLSQWQQRIRKSSYISLFYVSLHMCVSISLSLSVCLSACMCVCVSVCLHLFPFLNIISIAPAYLAPCVFVPVSASISLFQSHSCIVLLTSASIRIPVELHLTSRSQVLVFASNYLIN